MPPKLELKLKEFEGTLCLQFRRPGARGGPPDWRVEVAVHQPYGPAELARALEKMAYLLRHADKPVPTPEV